MTDRRRRLLLAAAVVVVVQLVLAAGVWIPAPHSGGDNAGYVALAHSLLEGRGYVEAWDPARPPHTKYPPVFPVLLAGAMAAGAESWTALKAVPAAATTLAVLLVLLWAARRRGPLFGAAVALLLASSSGLLWYSHWVLSDVPFLAATVLALYALERWLPVGEEGVPPEDSRPGGPVWLGVGLAAAVIAYFTRSAGLPLLVAVAGWLLLRRRWIPLGAFAVAAGAPALLWWARGRGGGTDYVGEFWMVDPYRPELGTVGPGGLVDRVVENAALYATRHVPEGILGVGGPVVTAAGLAILALAAVGWGMRFLPDGGTDDEEVASPAPGGRVHVAELFFPLYGGLVLLWPQVWSGDRFALPLFPLILFYAGDALLRAGRRAGPAAARVAGTVAFLAVAVPALAGWVGAREEARACARATRAVGAGPYACYGPAWEDFVDAARWSGANLRPGSAVLTRKPRIFYVMGGIPSRTYPFTTDPSDLVGLADEVGARYVLLDFLGRQGPTYVGGAVRARPDAFCGVGVFGGGTGSPVPGAQLLGITGIEAGPGATPGGETRIRRCGPELRPASERTPPPLEGLAIPLLSR